MSPLGRDTQERGGVHRGQIPSQKTHRGNFIQEMTLEHTIPLCKALNPAEFTGHATKKWLNKEGNGGAPSWLPKDEKRIKPWEKEGKDLGLEILRLELLWFGFEQKLCRIHSSHHCPENAWICWIYWEKILNGIKEQREEDLHNLQSLGWGQWHFLREKGKDHQGNVREQRLRS